MTGAAERKLLLSHTTGTVSTHAQFDACTRAAQEAAVVAAEFHRHALTREVTPLRDLMPVAA